MPGAIYYHNPQNSKSKKRKTVDTEYFTVSRTEDNSPLGDVSNTPKKKKQRLIEIRGKFASERINVRRGDLQRMSENRASEPAEEDLRSRKKLQQFSFRDLTENRTSKPKPAGEEADLRFRKKSQQPLPFKDLTRDAASELESADEDLRFRRKSQPVLFNELTEKRASKPVRENLRFRKKSQPVSFNELAERRASKPADDDLRFRKKSQQQLSFGDLTENGAFETESAEEELRFRKRSQQLLFKELTENGASEPIREDLRFRKKSQQQLSFKAPTENIVPSELGLGSAHGRRDISRVRNAEVHRSLIPQIKKNTASSDLHGTTTTRAQVRRVTRRKSKSRLCHLKQSTAQSAGESRLSLPVLANSDFLKIPLPRSGSSSEAGIGSVESNLVDGPVARSVLSAQKRRFGTDAAVCSTSGSKSSKPHSTPSSEGSLPPGPRPNRKEKRTLVPVPKAKENLRPVSVSGSTNGTAQPYREAFDEPLPLFLPDPDDKEEEERELARFLLQQDAPVFIPNGLLPVHVSSKPAEDNVPIALSSDSDADPTDETESGRSGSASSGAKYEDDEADSRSFGSVDADTKAAAARNSSYAFPSSTISIRPSVSTDPASRPSRSHPAREFAYTPDTRSRVQGASGTGLRAAIEALFSESYYWRTQGSPIQPTKKSVNMMELYDDFVS